MADLYSKHVELHVTNEFATCGACGQDVNAAGYNIVSQDACNCGFDYKAIVLWWKGNESNHKKQFAENSKPSSSKELKGIAINLSDDPDDEKEEDAKQAYKAICAYKDNICNTYAAEMGIDMKDADKAKEATDAVEEFLKNVECIFKEQTDHDKAHKIFTRLGNVIDACITQVKIDKFMKKLKQVVEKEGGKAPLSAFQIKDGKWK